ncbi:MAG: 4-(cytidine 5'-diphospho)-2-C-methyl-D-erythritol kinase [Chitinophagaceae bacterium]
MIRFPNCKINLGLQVLQKRGDGYHNISTLFYPLPLTDALEIVPASDQLGLQIYNYGLPVHGAPADNLCMKAWHLLKKDFPDLPAVQIHLLKNIPMGAGLGGGSADGAGMLQLLNNKYRLGITDAQLLHYALLLGSDCPFFILNKPCFALGRGEILTPAKLDLSGYRVLLIHPGIHVNTGWAFARLDESERAAADTVKEAIAEPISEWKKLLKNDFEQPVFAAHPEIEKIKENVYAMGAEYASMTGSGSTVFGLFKPGILPATGLPSNRQVMQL